jgi:aspartyl aminopeptidase
MTEPMPDVVDDLLAFLGASPSPYHAVDEAARRLEDNGFTEVDELAEWTAELVEGRHYVVRGGALVAWDRAANAPASAPFRLVGAHTDSPTLKVKPVADAWSVGWRQVAVEVYGGALVNSWLDRDLGLAGRLALRDGSIVLVRIDEPILRVPQLAIHLDRDVNERGLLLDRQQHLTPVWGLGPTEPGALAAYVAARARLASTDVTAWDLVTFDLTPPTRLGRDRELIASGRLDNLFSCWAATRALSSERDGPTTAVIALFDHEEVGSDSTTGAGGPLLEAVLERLVAAGGGGRDDLRRAFAGSLCASADMAHAVHPNYPERHEPAHRPVPGGGPVLKVNANQRYATDAPSAAEWARACESAGVAWQVFVSRNSMPCGSTIGPVTATRLGIDTVDVGCAMLSMHSARELAGAGDAEPMVAALTAWLSGS